MLKIYENGIFPTKCYDTRIDLAVGANGGTTLSWDDSGKHYDKELPSGVHLAGATFGEEFTMTPHADPGFTPAAKPVTVKVKGDPISVSVSFVEAGPVVPNAPDPTDAILAETQADNESWKANIMAILKQILANTEK